MQRDILLLTEMIEAAEQAQALAKGNSGTECGRGRNRRGARDDASAGR
jgi:hypothetical protein